MSPISTSAIVAVGENSFAMLDRLREEFSERAEFRTGPVDTPEQIAELTEGAGALAVTLHPLRREHIEAMSASVKIIARAGVGLDTIDVDAAQKRNIRVVFQPTYATNEVADQAASLALTAWRRVAQADSLVHGSSWGSPAEVGPVHALQDATLGVLGTGRIGQAFIRRLRPFVKRVVAFDVFRDPALSDVEWCETPAGVIAQANLLSLHLPLTADTRHILDQAAMASMPVGAVVVNVSRGGLVDEQALTESLRSGRIAAAALDVFETEPLPAESELRAAPNLLLTPHMAWYSIESGERLAHWTIDDAVSYLERGELRNGSWAWQ